MSPETSQAAVPARPTRVASASFSSLVALELRKLLGFRSVRLGAVAAFVLPFLLSFAPDDGLAKIAGINLILVSGWQVVGLALYMVMQFVLPLLVSVTCAELIGGEVTWGTLAPLLLRPVSRARVILAKLAVAWLYPFMLLLVTFLGSLVAGLRFGFASFAGGTGLGEGAFTGAGMIAPGAAVLELVRAYLIAGLTLAPIAALAVMFAVLYLSTAAAALATIALITLGQMLVIFPAITPFLLTSHLNAYTPGARTGNSLALLVIYALIAATATLFVFERKDL